MIFSTVPTLSILIIAGIAFTLTYAICSDDIAPSNKNPIVFIINLLAFNLCNDIPGWMSFVLFLFITFPLSLVLWGFIEPLFNNAVTGVITGIALATGAIVVGLTYLFS